MLNKQQLTLLKW